MQNRDRDLSWDPEGIFKDAASVSLFSDEPDSQETHPPLDPKFLLEHPIVALKGEYAAGIDSTNSRAYNRTKFEKSLREAYMPIDLNHPGVRIMHIDPPIFRVDGFWTVDQCEKMIDAARSTGKIATAWEDAVFFLETVMSKNTITTICLCFCRENETKQSWLRESGIYISAEF